jgi:NTE family protein
MRARQRHCRWRAVGRRDADRRRPDAVYAPHGRCIPLHNAATAGRAAAARPGAPTRAGGGFGVYLAPTPRTDPMTPRASPTAFVFAGGSSLGAIQVGMLQALLAHGWQADFVVGSSVGAINAAHFAGDPTADGVDRLARVWRGMKRSDVFATPALRSLVRLVSRHGHLVESAALARLIERHLPFRRLEEARLPCHIVVTDMLEGVEIRIAEGPAVPALLASAVSAAVELGAKRIVVLPTGYSCALDAPPRSAVATALHALNILISRQVTDAVRRCRSLVEVVVVPPLCPLGASPVDFSCAGALIDRARRSTEEWLGKGVEQVDGVPHQLPPHTHHPGADGPYGPVRLHAH